MTTAEEPTIAPPPDVPPPPKRPRRALRITGMIVGAVILLGAGVGVGAASNTHSGEIASQRAQISSLRQRLTNTQVDLGNANDNATNWQQQASTYQQQAADATTTADAKAKAEWASRMATVTALENTLKKEQGVVSSSTISADGVYVVGKDIPSGTYHTSGGSQCYYATLTSTNTFSIIDNNNFNGPETVNVSGAYAFQIQGGCTWVKI